MTEHMSNVHVSDGEGWEDFYFDTVEQAIAKAKEIEGEYEDGGYWYNDERGFWGRYGTGDYPHIVTVGVFDGMGNVVNWREEEAR